MRNRVLVKSVVAIFVCTMLISMVGSVSRADGVWEPLNYFCKQHEKEFKPASLELITNGPDGIVTVWETPVSLKEVVTLENGIEVYVSQTYTDKRGYEWGCYYNHWIPMDYLIVEPGRKNFYSKHEDEFEQEKVDFMIPEGVEEVFFWSYPGSGELKNCRNVHSDEILSVRPVYTDKDGRQWGYISHFQLAEGWICMSDPSNDQIPVNEKDAASVVTPPEPTVIIKPQPEGLNIVILIAILVLVVGAGTFVLIRILFKGKVANKAADAAITAEVEDKAKTVDASAAADVAKTADTPTTANVVDEAKAVDTISTADVVGSVEAPDGHEIK